MAISARGRPIHFMFGSTVGFSGSADRMALTRGNRAMQRMSQCQGSTCSQMYLRVSGVVALGSLLVQATHTESEPASEVGGQGHWTLGWTGGNQSKEWSGNGGARCVHMWVPPACMTRDNWACNALEGWKRYSTCAKDMGIG